MNTETKKCQNCKERFIIEPEDFVFYEKIKVPPPTFCPGCRQQRRYAWRNERVLYRRDCDLCGKSTVTIYSPNKPYKVYCPTCWWGDGWDAKELAKDFDFNRPFFEQFHELQLKVPRIALLTKNSVNSEYTNHAGNNKNCYLSFVIFDCENVLYSNWVMKSRDCLDCTYIYENLERSYECIDSRRCYQCQYGILLRNCTDCYYCYDCHNCSDCFLSFNLRNKKYHFLNAPYSKKDYFRKLAEFNLASYESRQELYNKYLKLISERALHRYIISEKSVKSKGESLFNCKNALDCFDVEKLEDCKYCVSAIDSKDCFDSYHFGFNTELVYEGHAIGFAYHNLFSHLSYDNSSISYCDSCHNNSNLFSCIGVRKGNYMVLNKQYNEEEYKKLKNKIIEHMKETGEYGEFFPASISPFGYNETQGQVYMPMTKEEALVKGFKWEDRVPGTFGKETIKSEDIPDDIKDVPDSITKEVLKCTSCTKNYNIVPQELEFYRKENIPIPRLCPDCRYGRRTALRRPRKLWHRKCQCAGVQSDPSNSSGQAIVYKNATAHSHHGKDHCPNEFETSYAPERKEIVYCEKCYQNEVV